MMGIIEDGCVWASNVSYLNDREELTHGASVLTRVLEIVTSER